MNILYLQTDNRAEQYYCQGTYITIVIMNLLIVIVIYRWPEAKSQIIFAKQWTFASYNILGLVPHDQLQPTLLS